MIVSLKALIVVLLIAVTTFHFAKPVALRFSTERDFSRRRNVWLLLTVTAFVSPNFWLFALVATPFLAWAGLKDKNPIAFYLLMLFVIPQASVDIPVTGINRLFSLDIYRLLSFCVLIPTAWRLRYSKDPRRIHGMTTMDVLLLAYGVLQILLFIPYESPTNTLRRTFLFFIDVYVLYFVVSRACASRKAIVEALAALCLSCVVMAPLAVFEVLRHWLLYTDITTRWSLDPTAGVYFYRGGTLRAQVSAGHPLALGYLLAIAFGFWLYLHSQVKSAPQKIAVTIVLWLGLLATYSRGPWVGAIAIYFAFAALRPRAVSMLLKAGGLALIAGAVISLTPLGERIISVMPFLGGSVDSESILYRQRLAERSWELFQQHPFFGDQLVLSKMNDLRQGQGIIDLVNTYAEVALFDGLAGLSLFIGFILLGLYRAYNFARNVSKTDPDLTLLGVCLVACILGTLLMIATCSFIFGYVKMFYVLAGLAAAYAHLGIAPQKRAATYTAPRRLQQPRKPMYGLNRSPKRH